MLEEHAWRTVQLRNDDALGAVDDERSPCRSSGHFTHVDLLFLHFLDHLGLRRGRFAVIDNQLNRARTAEEGEATGLVSRTSKAGLASVLTNFISTNPLCETIGNVELNAAQAFASAFSWPLASQEGGVGVLCICRRWDLEHAVAGAETFADTLAFGIRVGHEISGLDWGPGSSTTELADPKYPRGLGGWPLPTMADGDALHGPGTKAPSAVGFVRNTSKPGGSAGSLLQPVFQPALATRQRLEACEDAPAPAKETELLEFGLAPASTSFLTWQLRRRPLAMPSLTFLGAPSTRSLASFEAQAR